MTRFLYKYVGPSYLDRVFSGVDRITLKCSLPKDFNDPYELFLTVDFNQEPGALAFYQDAIGQLPQLPTTCFSRSPSVIPMWAHYAQNSEGVVVELSEDALSEAFPESDFGDVDYRDTPHEGLVDMLHRAHQIGKPRYVYLLNKGVFIAAYYTKTESWSYELERRMIVRESEVRREDNLLLADVPKTCVSTLIVGSRATEGTKRLVRERSALLGCRYFEMRVGRTSASPYFVDDAGEPYTFDSSQLKQSSQYCGSCKEPIAFGSDECSWCRIGDSHTREAAARNPFRMLHQYGMLGSYLEGMEAISRRGKKR